MFRRKIMLELENWKNSTGKKKALVIKGLRQIGKTYSVRDGSEWETLKRRLHDRLDVSKNIVLFLRKNKKNSKNQR